MCYNIDCPHCGQHFTSEIAFNAHVSKCMDHDMEMTKQNIAKTDAEHCPKCGSDNLQLVQDGASCRNPDCQAFMWRDYEQVGWSVVGKMIGDDLQAHPDYDSTHIFAHVVPADLLGRFYDKFCGSDNVDTISYEDEIKIMDWLRSWMK